MCVIEGECAITFGVNGGALVVFYVCEIEGAWVVIFVSKGGWLSSRHNANFGQFL